MLSLAWASVRGQLPRFGMTAIAIVLGVGLVIGVSSLCGVINGTFGKLIGDTSKSMDVYVRPAEDTNIGVFNKSGRTLPLTFEHTLRDVTGTKDAHPVIMGNAVLVDADGNAVRRGGAPTLGFAYDPADPVVTVTNGRAPENSDEVLAEHDTLALSGLSVGDTTEIVVNTERRDVTIVGEAIMGSRAGTSVLLFDKETATADFAPNAEVSNFVVRRTTEVSAADLATAVAETLPDGFEAITSATFRDEKQRQAQSEFGFVTTFLIIFGAVSLLAGTFIIVNTFMMALAQRAKQVAMLRAIGLQRHQILFLVAFEALCLGAVGAIGGLIVGTALSLGLITATNTALGFDMATPHWWSPTLAAQSASIGIGVCLGAAIIPAWTATRISPIETMRRAAGSSWTGHIAQHPLRAQASLAAFLLALGTVLAGLTWPDESWLRDAFGIIPTICAAALLALGTMVAAAPAVAPVTRLLSKPLRAARDVVADIATGNAARSPHRAAITSVALTVGLSLVCGIGVLSESAWASNEHDLQTGLRADLVVQGPLTGLPPDLSESLQTVDGVTAALPLAEVTVRIDDDAHTAHTASLEHLPHALTILVAEGEWTGFDGDTIAVDAHTAAEHDWLAGQTVQLGIGNEAPRALTVAAIYQETATLSGILLDDTLLEGTVNPTEQLISAVFVTGAPDVPTPDLRDRIRKITDPLLTVDVQDQTEYAASRGQELKQILAVINSLLVLAILIAGLGVANTLGMSIYERTREIGVLRALGLGRRQLWRMVTLEALWLAIFGAILGVGLGVALGLIAVQQLRDSGLTVVSVPWATMGWVMAGSCLLGVTAALLPALRATRINVLAAIASQ